MARYGLIVVLLAGLVACDDDGDNGGGNPDTRGGGDQGADNGDGGGGGDTGGTDNPAPAACGTVCPAFANWLVTCEDLPSEAEGQIAAQCTTECNAVPEAERQLPRLCVECLESAECDPCCIDYHCAGSDADPALSATCEPPPPAVDCTAGNDRCFWDSDCAGNFECNSETGRCFDPGDTRNCSGTPCFWDSDCVSNDCNSVEETCN